jgi:hypothetical protein
MKAEIAKFSAHADRLDAYEARLDRLTDVPRALAVDMPPNLATGLEPSAFGFTRILRS